MNGWIDIDLSYPFICSIAGNIRKVSFIWKLTSFSFSVCSNRQTQSSVNDMEPDKEI